MRAATDGGRESMTASSDVVDEPVTAPAATDLNGQSALVRIDFVRFATGRGPAAA